MSSQAKREALAVALRGAVPDGWTVYSWPTTVPIVPACIIGPGSPYRVPVAGGAVEGGSLRVTVLYPVAAGALGFEAMDEAMDALLPAIDLVSECAWMRADMPGTVVSAGGAEYFAATIDVDTL